MLILFKALKWIFGIISAILSVLLMAYVGMKNDEWAIVASNGDVVIDKNLGVGLIVVWAVIGALYLVFEYLYKRTVKNKSDSN